MNVNIDDFTQDLFGDRLKAKASGKFYPTIDDNSWLDIEQLDEKQIKTCAKLKLTAYAEFAKLLRENLVNCTPVADDQRVGYDYFDLQVCIDDTYEDLIQRLRKLMTASKKD